MSDCAFLADFGIDLNAMDLAPRAQELRDPRIGNAIIIDPEIISTINDDSLREIDIPMLIINLGAEDRVPAGVYAADAVSKIATARHLYIDDATHFSFQAECTEREPQILLHEGNPDPLCQDAGGRPRAAIHAELIDIMTEYLADAT